MSEHQKDTAFLRHCISYDESTERRELDARLIQIHSHERSVRRAVWLMAILSALSVTGLVYSAILIDNFPQDTSQLIVRIISIVGLASVVCLIVFLGLSLVYRIRLNHHREECRQLVKKLLESRLGKAVATSRREIYANGGNLKTVPVVAEGNRSPQKTESAA